MRRTAIMLAVVVVGCTPTDPVKSRLGPGQSAIVVLGPNDIAAMLSPIDGDSFPQGSPGYIAGALTTGDGCRVIADEDKSIADDRPVVIEVTRYKRAYPDIDLVGLRCCIRRKFLRPSQ